MFKKVKSQVNFPKLEEKILQFWKKNKIFKKSLRRRKDAKNFVFYEGPPTANGKPGSHHVLSRVFKDVIPRYKTMCGFYVERKGGWDTHGLPVELEVEKEIGISGKPEIEKYGIAKFNKKCKQSVFKYEKEWKRMTQRVGFWLDMDNPYITYSNDYMESVWWVIKQIWDKGLLFRDYKVVPWCPRCGTALSSHEVALGYQDITEPSIYIKFKLEGEKNTYLLAWTTTPWTLPGNVALAINPKIKYVKAKVGKEYFILAKSRVEVLDNYKIVEEITTSDLLGKKYKPLFTFTNPEKPCWCVISGDFVTTEDGTGIVHIAPAFGEDDLNVGKENDLPLVCDVSSEGKFTSSVKPYAGMFVKDADPKIIKDLKDKGVLYKEEKFTHTYPFCWRCDTHLLYFAKKTWFIRMSSQREKLIKNNRKINWYPSHIKNGRFGEWISSAKDWALLRERYWGTPIPIWKCEKCKKFICIGSKKELRTQSLTKFSKDLDLHRPYIDKIKLRCKCGGHAFRLPFVIDCWFDSGSMPYAQWHYPFENQEKFKKQFPADFISEAIDQTRGWFYTLLAISTLLDLGPTYRNVICLGHILDEGGVKMSKSKGNVVDPWVVLEKHGADAFRWYMYTATSPGDSRCFSVNLVEEVVRKFLSTLWNTYSFFIIYAKIDKFVPKNSSIFHKKRALLDRWILSKLNELVLNINKKMDNYDITSAGRELEKFIDELSNWYVRRSRRRFWKSENDKDKQTAYQTLYEVLVTLSKLLAPFTPFISEEIYQNLVYSVDRKAPDSVHLCDYPKADKKLIDNKLNQQMDSVRKVVEVALAERAEAGIKVRQPLASCRIYGIKKLNKELSDLIIDEINVKKLEFVSGKELRVKLDTKLTHKLKQEGISRDIVRVVQQMRKKADFNISDRITTFYYTSDKEILSAVVKHNDYIKKETLSLNLIFKKETKVDIQGAKKLGKKQIWLGLKK